jgi:hypothetical protein
MNSLTKQYLSLMKTRVFTSSLLSLMFIIMVHQVKAQWTTAGNNIYNSNTGNVGINNTNPLVKLAVDISSTTTTYNGYTGANVALMLKNKSNTANNFTVLSFANSGTNTIADITAINTNHSTHTGRLSFSPRAAGASPQQRMLIDENGNVGIGTTSPGGKLEINHAGGQIKLTGGTIAGGLWTNAAEALYLADWNTGTKGLLINMSTGNIGIGTSSPTSKLQVLSNDAIGAALNSEVLITRSGTSVANLQSLDLKLRKYSTTDNAWWGNGLRLQRNIDNFANSCYIDFGASEAIAGSGSHELGFGVDNTEHMRISQNGNVGIGTTTPSNVQGWHRVLDVSGTNHSKILATAVNSTYKVGIFAHDPSWYGGGGLVGTESNHNLFFITNYDAKMMIGTNGNVGIGTTTPDAKLAVKGTIHTQEVRVDLNGAVAPDYVFESDYSLMPLDELKTYLDTNKHLPEVPSAKEMEANGVNLKEMNLLLLKKVEELTLHVIELKKRDDEQQKEIVHLKKICNN